MTGLQQILVFAGAVGLFLYGMKTLSEAVQKLTGESLRSLLKTVTKSPARGILTGAAITGVIQSSSAMTVMVVSFVNAGLLSLRQSIGLIMGANIGTTVTAWLVALFGFYFDLDIIALPLIAVAFPLLLFRNERVKTTGEALIGLALFLLAIGILKLSMESLGSDAALIGMIEGIQSHTIWAPLCFVGIGALFTFIVQSSSAAMALTIILSGKGIIPFDCAMALVLGQNIGTTLTANLAALVANTTAKQAALCHFLFNLIGVLWALPLLYLWGEKASQLITSAGGGLLSTHDLEAQTVGLALFHTLFNVINTLVLAHFIPQLARLSEWIIPSKKEVKKESRLLEGKLLSMGELSIYQTRNEIRVFAKRTFALFTRVKSYFSETNPERAEKLLRMIESERNDLVELHKSIHQFVNHSARERLSQQTQRVIQRLTLMLSQWEGVLELLELQTQTIRRKREEQIWFSQSMRDILARRTERIDQSFQLLLRALERSERPEKLLERVLQLQTSRGQISEEEMLHTEEEPPNYRANLLFMKMGATLELLAYSTLKLTEESLSLEH